ncbi:uncharacterized protein LOC114254645 isoform X2 [Monomorium pharaonis]|uniref:uncharacterized protein LOC114254645 isoform X2 n=1 Tax=Monomorium pharaonis TaxID=307658 RepID=UPI00174601C5|nr:uncharacterized protein LOC114254645 isoform X2 [Monomorium pharaonis]
MDNKQNISITKLTNAADTLDNQFSFDVARKRQDCDLTTENVKPHFKPWRIFINHIDSYHGKILTDVLSDTIYMDPLSTHIDVPADEENKFEYEGNEYVEGNEKEKRKWSGKSTEVPRKYEVIGTVLDRKYSTIWVKLNWVCRI